eukprot:150122_1
MNKDDGTKSKQSFISKLSKIIIGFILGIFMTELIHYMTDLTSSINIKQINEINEISEHTDVKNNSNCKVWFIEAGTNNGGDVKNKWKNICFQTNKNQCDCNVVFFEPQPRFRHVLQQLENEINNYTSKTFKVSAKYYENAVWNKDGEILTFNIHAGALGIGSSLIDGSVYQNVGTHSIYNVTTIDLALWFEQNCEKQDEITLRLDIEGAEYTIIRHLINRGVACWLDMLYFEGHSMYAKSNHYFRLIDVTIPWILRDCGVRFELETYYNPYDEGWRNLATGRNDPKVTSQWPNDDIIEQKCKYCPLLYVPLPESGRTLYDVKNIYGRHFNFSKTRF